ncbi:MAG: hypothetical protein KJO69_03785, partial [Gammaproteobacteria bacterium]|nr:hypothetical protein [Gammaproteobacteria bacterium]
IGVADAASLTVEQAVALLENVLVEGDHFYNGVMSTHTGEMIRLSELIIYGQYAQLLDSLSVSEDLNLRLLMSVTPQSSLNASETSQTSVAGYLSNEDDVDLNDSNLSKWISTTEIEEDLKVGNFFTEDSIKGWVMNPENYAITNYTLGFTGAANFGSDYLFADDTGLYALEGTTDNGAEISSIITTAALDFGLDDIKQVPQVLLGTNGTDLILKVSIDGEYTAIYRHEGLNSDLETKRFKIGKGLVATNWQFSLYTINNSNLNLDSFEFYPVVFKRKHNG